MMSEIGFPKSEYDARIAAIQSAMQTKGFDALLLTTPPDLYYFTGFLTRFWESPARPWFLIIPANKKPIAVIPSIGAVLMAKGAVEDIRTWRAPDLEDDGVGLLSDSLREVVGPNGTVAMPMGHETALRMPLADFERLKTDAKCSFVSDQEITKNQQMVKSDLEISKIRDACAIGDRAFARVGEITSDRPSLAEVYRRFQILLLEEGADYVSYLAGASEQGGYGDVISPAHHNPIRKGDILMLDTGAVKDGYFCDFDRNFSIGPASQSIKEAHKRLIAATHAGFAAAKPGARAADLFHAMNDMANPSGEVGEAGRLGHGLGMRLTEWPSFIPTDMTILKPGMVLTLEPSVDLGASKLMVHEENIVITDAGAEFLTTPYSEEIKEV